MTNLKFYLHKGIVSIEKVRFPAGESLIRIEEGFTTYPNETLKGMISLSFKDNGDLIDLMLLVDAIKRHFIQGVELSLNLDYLPYARQDRVCNKGESLSIKVICDLINNLNFKHVYCKDIHSEVGVSLLNNLTHFDLTLCAAKLVDHCLPENTVLVSPDAGANKKVFAFAKDAGYEHVVRADKVREVSTGKIKETVVYSEHVGNKDFLILDDCADGGRTFIELAKVLRNLTHGKIYLYVTHGIFTKGMQEIDMYINHCFTSNLMGEKTNTITII